MPRDGSGGGLVDCASSLLGYAPAAGMLAVVAQQKDTRWSWLSIAAFMATSVALKLFTDVSIMMRPPFFVDLTRLDRRVEREKRPINDAILHVLLFRWKILGSRNRIICNILEGLNRGYDFWDQPFSSLGQTAENEVLKYCRAYGVELPDADGRWEWSKAPSEYRTMNEWFTRTYRADISPETVVDEALVVAPATAVVSMFDSVSEMPRVLKNDTFTIEECGIPNPVDYQAQVCTIHYLSPADYHCFHTPIAGKVVCCKLVLDGPYSVTVKPYVFSSINILERNRRAIVVIESADGFRVAMVIIGGVTVDSIRLETGFVEGATVRSGQRIGCFARGGSSIAMFYNRPVRLLPALSSIRAKGMDTKIKVASGLMEASLCDTPAL